MSYAGHHCSNPGSTSQYPSCPDVQLSQNPSCPAATVQQTMDEIQPGAMHRRAAAMACTVVLFGLSVNSILSCGDWVGVQRDLDVVEMFAGVASVTKAARGLGLTAEPYDILRSPQEDITTAGGFRTAVKLAMRLKAKGLLTLAPVCSSFGYACSHQTGRKKINAFVGNAACQCVASGNLMANAAMLLLCLALARGVEVSLENPANSWIFGYLGENLSRLPNMVTGTCNRCAYLSDKEFQKEPWSKKFKFIASGNWILQGMRRCSCNASRAHKPLMLRNEQGQVNGNQTAMKASGAYPLKLGQAIIRAWHAWNAKHLSYSASCPAVQLSSHRTVQLPASSSRPAVLQCSSKRKSEDFMDETLSTSVRKAAKSDKKMAKQNVQGKIEMDFATFSEDDDFVD